MVEKPAHSASVEQGRHGKERRQEEDEKYDECPVGERRRIRW